MKKIGRSWLKEIALPLFRKKISVYSTAVFSFFELNEIASPFSKMKFVKKLGEDMVKGVALPLFRKKSACTVLRFSASLNLFLSFPGFSKLGLTCT